MTIKVDIMYPYTKGKWKGEIWIRNCDIDTISNKTIDELESLSKLLSGYRDQKGSVKPIQNIAPLILNESQPNKILSIVHSLDKNGIESVTTDEIQTEWKRMRLGKLPGNIHDVLNQLIRKGHIMESDLKDGKKAWAITQLGIIFVEEKVIAKN